MIDGSIISKFLRLLNPLFIIKNKIKYEEMWAKLRKVYRGKRYQVWIRGFKEMNKKCLKAEFKLISDSTCQICSSKTENVFSKDGRFNIGNETCSNLLDSCTNYWKDIVNLHDQLIKFKFWDTESSQNKVQSLKDAINKEHNFWDKIKGSNSNSSVSIKSELCGYFFNVLDYTPKILQSAAVKNVFDYDFKNKKRVLMLTASQSSLFSNPRIGEPRLDETEAIFGGGCNQDMAYMDSKNRNKKFVDPIKNDSCKVMWGNQKSCNYYEQQLQKDFEKHCMSSIWEKNKWVL